MRFLRDWLPLIVLALICYGLGRSCQRAITTTETVLIQKTDTLTMPPDTVENWKTRWIHHWAEAKPETIIQYEAVSVLPTIRITSLDWDRGKLHFLTDAGSEGIYSLPKTTYAFSVRAKHQDFFVKYRTRWWEPRLIAGAMYPFDAFLRFELNLREKLVLQGEATRGGWNVGVGWRIF